MSDAPAAAAPDATSATADKWASVAATVPTYEPKAGTGGVVKGRSPWRDAMDRLLRNRAAVVGAVIVVAMFLVCMIGPLFSSYAGDTQFRDRIKQSPSGQHWAGTDIQGRDLLVRVMNGGQISFLVALISTSISLVVGVAYGAIAGLKGGRTDNLMMRIVDVMYGLPYIFIVILLMMWFNKGGIVPLFIGLGMVSWLTIARIVRGQVIALRNTEFVTAARVAGARTGRIIVKHLLPNLLGIIVVYTTLTVPRVMLEEAFLSFLGLGVQAPDASWGSLASDAIKNRDAWWLMAAPASAMFITLMALNFVGDGLRDALDPKEKKV
jgi:oligopeptide transport system permease protein